MPPVLTPDFAIAGAGIIGLTLALELQSRGASVAVLDTAAALGGASSAAAGMLAAEDPHNPAELRELCAFSISLYDLFLDRLSALSGLDVHYQTTTTIQYLDDGGPVELQERSVDPRQLSAAALQAVRRSGIPLLENCVRLEITEAPDGITLTPNHGPALAADRLIHASGAWFTGQPAITPRKGQMLRVRLPSNLRLDQVHRSPSIYVVPRTHGPQAGTALIGATEEDAGFDLRTCTADLDALRLRASSLLPALADSTAAPQVEAWAGLRPAAADGLPLIGKLPGHTRQWIAGGHYRNGILLAPATAHALADLLENKPAAIDLRPFDPARPMQ
ncbi:MAG TPA: FAD-dependent oxidoreductase [Acidobacteriaceae bacterium]|nr:FAD-dependent oxidoreductase [Acidobacteriaceae bacterium]